MKSYTVTIEHGPLGRRTLLTLEVEARSFDHAVFKAKKGLFEPRAMKVTDHGELAQNATLFEEQA